MRALLVRRERVREVRELLLSRGIEFFEERDNYHFLFIFPKSVDLDLNGKWCYLVNENIDEIETKGNTFKIDGPRDTIGIFAPQFEKRGLKVKMDDPDCVIEIKKWGKKYLISVSSVFP